VWVLKVASVEIPLDALYDLEIKRFYEYKRQLLSIFHTIHRYLMIKECVSSKIVLQDLCLVSS